MTRRDDRGYREYLREEQRSQRGCIAGRMQPEFHHGLLSSTNMDYRRLGSTGLRISRLGLGCGNFGGIGSSPAFFGMGETRAPAFRLMGRAFDPGAHFFDTANAYGGAPSATFILPRLPATRPPHLNS